MNIKIVRFLLPLLTVCSLCACSGGMPETVAGDVEFSTTSAAAAPEVKADVSNLNVTSFVRDNIGHIWIGTARGLNRYNGHDFTQYFDFGTRDSYVKALCCDLRGRIWVVSNSGVSVRNSDDRFEAVTMDGNPIGSADAIVASADSSVFVARGCVIYHYSNNDRGLHQVVTCPRTVRWIGVDEHGNLLSYSDATVYLHGCNSLQCLKTYTVGGAYRVWHGANGRLWLMTSQGLKAYDTATESFISLDVLAERYPVLRTHNIKEICPLQDGNVLISTVAGMIYCNTDSGTAVSAGSEGFPFECPVGIVNKIYSDGTGGNLWFGIEDRGFATVDATKTRFDAHRRLTGTFRDKPITGLLVRDNILYISTRNEGLFLYDCNSGRIWAHPVAGEEIMRLNMHIVPNDGVLPDSIVRKLSCPDISAILADSDGNLWISTLYGLNRYNPGSGVVTRYFAGSGTGGNQYYMDAAATLPDGCLTFGGMHGLTVVDPKTTFSASLGPLAFEKLKVHNRTVNPVESPRIISRGITERPDIHLDHENNSFSLSFTSLGYNSKVRPLYFHKLEGYDSYWIETGEVGEASYANVPAGHYTLRVKAADADSGAMSEELTLSIDVAPAPWLSWWAWAIYLAAALIIIAAAYYLRRKYLQQKESARSAIAEKQSEQKINEMNMNYFVNVSHEFRTPLSMIAGPVGQLLSRKDLAPDNRRLLEIVNGSINRMLKLVNRMLDFHKVENGTLHLEVSIGDVSRFVESVIGIYRINANEKKIELQTLGLGQELSAVFDRDKLETILTNLLSNAMRYTPAGGNIKVVVELLTRTDALMLAPENSHRALTADNYVRISVSDSGEMVPESKLERIFERFYQLDGANKGIYNHGSGIGLYFARLLATLHHGILFATNEYAGENPGAGGCCGTTVFTLLFPSDESAYPDSELYQGTETLFTPGDASTVEVSASVEEADLVPDMPLLLLVDDDTDVIRYLRTLFEANYRILACFDAASALSEAKKNHPDLILSDVAMPGESGYDLCRKIRNDDMLCHIPVILVTAKARVEDQVAGLGVGADAYVTKPFNPDYVQALVKSTLENRQRIVGRLRNSTSTKEIGDDISELDRRFMDELYKVMEAEMANPELDIIKLSGMLCVSRTKLYYKIKSLSGMTPGNFFKTYKLNRVVELMAENSRTLSEIAAMTGFSSREQMTSVFKKHFGVTPTEYRGNHT